MTGAIMPPLAHKSWVQMEMGATIKRAPLDVHGVGKKFVPALDGPQCHDLDDLVPGDSRC